MTRTHTDSDVLTRLLDAYGRTFSDEIGISLERGKPSDLFQLLCASILMSARIGSDIAVRAARSLTEEGWTTPDKLAGSTWEQRVRALNRAGYARYQERTASMLGDVADQVRERAGGDLRRLRGPDHRDGS